MTSGETSALLIFAGTYAAVVSVPGPNFLVVSRASLMGRPLGTAAALGVASGAALLAGIIALALGLFNRIGPDGLGVVQFALALLYGTLLIRAGVGALLDLVRAAPLLAMPNALLGDRLGAFRMGLLTASTNPTSLAFFLSSCQFLMADAGRRATVLASPVLVFSVALCWFGTLGLLLSAPATRRLYRELKSATDLAMGLLLLVAGCLVLAHALQQAPA